MGGGGGWSLPACFVAQLKISVGTTIETSSKLYKLHYDLHSLMYKEVTDVWGEGGG